MARRRCCGTTRPAGVSSSIANLARCRNARTPCSTKVGGFSKILDVVPKVAPLKRNITADDVGDTAVYLASDLSRVITGDVHFVDAGYHAMGMYPPELQV